MHRTLTLDELWSLAETTAKARNGLVHHSCCDVWTTRAAKLKRTSHHENVQWRHFLLSLDKSFADKKQAFLAKMTEEGWQLPAILNQTCQGKSSLTLRQRAAFRPLHAGQPPQELQTSSAFLELVCPTQITPEIVTTSGTNHFI